MIRRGLAIAAAFAAAGAASIAAAEPARTAPGKAHDAGGVSEHAQFNFAPVGPGFKQLAIDNPLGDVRIEGYDGAAIQIETIKHAPDDETIDRLRVSVVPGSDGVVRIGTAAESGRERKHVTRGAVRVDLVIHAPRAARIDATVAAGKLELVNMDGGGELDTASGAIVVRNVAGELWTHSVSGTMSLTQVFGSVDAASVASDLDLDSIGGEKLVASVDRGKIAGRRVHSQLVELTSTDGAIQLEADAALHGRVTVSSLRGNVAVRLHRHGMIDARVRAPTAELAGQRLSPGADGWAHAEIGHAQAGEAASMVELASRFGVVQLVVLD